MAPKTVKKRTLSSEGRKKIADAQKLRWAMKSPETGKIEIHPSSEIPSTSTLGLAENARMASEQLLSRIGQLTDRLISNPLRDDTGKPVEPGLNGTLLDAHEVITKLGAYLGIEV